MRRLIIILCSMLLVFLFSCCTFGRESDISPTVTITPTSVERAGELPGRDLVTPAPGGSKAIVGVVVEQNGTQECIPFPGMSCSPIVSSPTVTSTPSATLIPTNTLRPTKRPSLTPTPSSTPTATLTSTRTPRPPTKTPIPANTATYTLTPTELPPDDLPTPQQERIICLGLPVVDLNIRDDVWGKWIGQFKQEDIHVMTLEARRIDDDGQVWYAFWFDWSDTGAAARYGWSLSTYITITYDDRCIDLPEDPELPIGPQVLGCCADVYKILDHIDSFGLLKVTDDARMLFEESKRKKPELITVHRNIFLTGLGLRNCPDDWGRGNPVTSARNWWTVQMDTWRARNLLTPGLVDYYEYRNECGFAPDWEQAFDLEIMRLANIEKMCVALFSDSYGTPEPAEFASRSSVLDYALRYECQPGRRHAISSHVYGRVSSGPWIFFRWLMFKDALPKDYPLWWLFTEFGVTNADGNVDGRGQPVCSVAAAEIVEAVIAYKRHPEVLGAFPYSFGHGTEWLDLTPCLPEIASALSSLS